MQLLSIAGEAEEVKDHLMVNLNDTTDGKSLVTWFSDKNVIFDGNILTLRFKVDKDKLGSGADITLSWDKDDLCDEDLNTVEATINYGKVLRKIRSRPIPQQILLYLLHQKNHHHKNHLKQNQNHKRQINRQKWIRFQLQRSLIR